MESDKRHSNIMGRLTKRQSQAQKTRKSLYDTAVRLFNERGYDNVTVDEIVKEANTSKGAFYFYFKSKESILFETILQLDVQYQEWYDILDKTLSTAEQLLLFSDKVQTYVESVGVETTRVLYASQINSTRGHPGLLNDENRAFFVIVKKIISKGQESGDIRTDISSDELTRIVTRWIRSIVYNWCLYEGSYDIVEDGRKYFGFSLPALEPKP